MVPAPRRDVTGLAHRAPTPDPAGAGAVPDPELGTGQAALPGFNDEDSSPGRASPSWVREGLGRNEILAALPAPAFRALADRAVKREVERGRVLLLEGAPRAGDTEPVLYGVLAGWCKVVRYSTEGRETVLDLRGRGDLVGEEALVLAGSARPPSLPGAIALTECTVAAMPGPAALETIRETPASREALLRRLAGRVLDAQLLLADRARPVPDRLIGILRRLTGGGVGRAADAGPGRNGSSWVRVPPLAQHDLALLVGASRETVNRALATLAASGQVALLRGQPVAVLGSSSWDGRG